MSDSINNTVNQCLRAVWQRSQRKHAIAGLLAFARWFFPLFVAVIIIDRYAYFPGWLRALVAIILLVVAIRKAMAQGWGKLQTYNATRTAQQVEKANGGMDSLLVTAVEFDERGAAPGTSSDMWQLAVAQAQEAAADVEPDKVIKLSDLKKPFQIAGGVAAVLLLIAIFNGSFLFAGLGRLFAPWIDIAYPTDTKIDIGEGELVIKEGAPASIEIRISEKIPKFAKLAIQTGEGRPRELEVEVIDGVATYELASASRDFTYRVKAGDARSDWRPVRVIKAPRLDKVAVALDFPDYIDRDTETLEALTLTVPEETMVGWKLTLDSPIREATLHRDGVDDLPLEIGKDGRTLTLSEKALASRGYSFSWTEDGHGFDFTSPRYFLQVASDQVPRIELTKPETNLVALLNRPLQLAVRAQDDHGIGTATITYRVNRRPEKVVKLAESVMNGQGEQVLDWDYRKELPDLQVGDSVSFVVEVADKYPGEGGPHKARTETRRISFLSREDYLAEITKQMDRLLTRVRALYRQERAAHVLVSGLDPMADSYISTCQLEAIRQEMVREQLVATADEVQALLDDLAANQISEAVESDMLASLQNGLRAIAKEDVVRAADLLRAQVGAKTRDPLPAIAAVNKAARELAVLVMQRGIDASREVFARETHMLGNELAGLRLRLINAAPKDGKGDEDIEAVAVAHENVAVWTDELLANLTKHMDYEKKALHVLGLSRRIHALRTGGLNESLRNAAKLARAGKLAEAASTQYPYIRALIEAEFTMRQGSQFAQMRELREQVTAVIAGQQKLNEDSKQAEDLAQLAKRQTKLRDQLVLAKLPSIPAPRPTLFDLALMPVPPSDDTRLAAEAAMTKALASLKSNSKDEALKSQGEALAAAQDFGAILETWSVELAQMVLGVSTDVSDASERVGICEKLEAAQVALVEVAMEAALDEKNPVGLLDDQQTLLLEVIDLRKELVVGEQGAPKILLPLLGRLDAVVKSMESSVALLKEKKLEDALEFQEKAADALAEARVIVEQQLAQYNKLQALVGFKQAVGDATAGMDDVLGGQNDLIAATKVADEKGLEALLAPQKNLLTCLGDIAPSLDLVAARMDVGTPLVFAASDVEDALLAMEDGDAEDATEIQGIAVESLTKVSGLVAEIAVQTGYIAEIVQYLNGAQSDANFFAFRQRGLREDKPEDLLVLQQTLLSETETYSRVLIEVAGNTDFDKLDENLKEKFEGMDMSINFETAASSMKEAVALLKNGEDATDAMAKAEQALRNNSEQMSVIIEMLNGVPSAVVTNAEPPELHRLIDVLDVAAKQREILRETTGAANEALAGLAKRQEKITGKLEATNAGDKADPVLDPIHADMKAVLAALMAGKKDEAGKAQKAADMKMRHYIIQWALILNTAIPPGSSSDIVPPESETNDLYETDTAGFVSDFVSGEGPEDKESEWDPLGERNRAALNQNFARELPLEYRATLKNYYERVAK